MLYHVSFDFVILKSIILSTIPKNEHIMKIKILLILFSLITGFVNAQPETEKKLPWDYPVKPGMEEWRQFKTGRQRFDACQIPQKVLESLKTDDLAEICMQYPLYIEYGFLNDERSSTRFIIENFNGLKELSRRKDGTKALINIYKDFPVLSEMLQESSKDFDAPIKIPFLELLLSDSVFVQQMDERLAFELEKTVLGKYLKKLENNHIYGFWNIKHTFLLGATVMDYRNKYAHLPEVQEVIKRYIENFNYPEAYPELITEISKIISEI